MVCRHRLGEPESSGLPGRRPWRVFGRASRWIEELCDWLIARTGATPEVIGVAIEMTQGPVVEALSDHLPETWRWRGSRAT